MTPHLFFIKESRILATPERVFAFHESPQALQSLIPPWENMKVVASDQSLKPGSRVVLEGKLFGIFPVQWIAEHRLYEPPHLFSDVQIKGPFAFWHHKHHMIDDGHGCTLLRDEIEYLPPLGILGKIAGEPLIRKQLQRMFDYRHETTRKYVENQKKP